MNEIERLLAQKIIDPEFLREEEMNEFRVDIVRKQIWAIELDLLLKFDTICKKHGLIYFLFWGSLLGAVRHKGIVPWDDDTDVIMPRKDYEELLTYKDEFDAPYFLQTPYTDKGYYYAHAKLRNSNTSAIDYPFLYQGFNMGIFVDILPLDNIDEDNRGRELLNRISELNILNSIAMRLNHPYLSERDKRRVETYSGGDPLERYEEIRSLSMRDYDKYTDKVSVFAATTYGYDRDVFYKGDFSDSVKREFLGYSFPVPIGYDRILKIAYGNYMEFPPVEKRGQWHSNVSFFPTIPYKQKIIELIDNDNKIHHCF